MIYSKGLTREEASSPSWENADAGLVVFRVRNSWQLTIPKTSQLRARWVPRDWEQVLRRSDNTPNVAPKPRSHRSVLAELLNYEIRMLVPYSPVDNLIFFFSLQAALIWLKKKGTIISIIIPQQFFLLLSLSNY